jgi:hypothetical protein
VWLVVGAAVLVAPAAVTAAPAGAITTSAECTTVVSQMKDDLATLAPPAGQTLTPAEAKDAAAEAADIFATAKKDHPSCGTAIDRLGAQLAAAAEQAATIKGTPFLGPIGWAWNNVYYEVFNGNDIMMAMFGWALLLSPFILVFAVAWVMRGSQGAFRRPYVPPHLRTEL